ncbi:PLDc N-terminal domain-containing protein [Corynebacterium hylobatis]|nr:PLDc N-terminal domain-containing protein [Corynebacterium hylobatis]
MSSRNPSLAKLRTDFTAMSTPARISLIVGVVVEVSAKIAAWVDLSRRPAEKVRGPKWAWALAQLINGLGPAAYWSLGRK